MQWRIVLCTLALVSCGQTVDTAPMSNVDLPNDDTEYSRPSDDVLQEKLTPLQYKVTQKNGTEPAFDNAYWDNTQEGIYVDIVSGEPLFSSQHQFKSGTGWPSFTQPLVPDNIVHKKDFKLVLPRTEVRSKHGDSHLGHVFKDGPEPTGLRYCMNSAALRFIPKDRLEEEGYGEYASLFQDASSSDTGAASDESSARNLAN